LYGNTALKILPVLYFWAACGRADISVMATTPMVMFQMLQVAPGSAVRGCVLGNQLSKVNGFLWGL